MDCSWLPAVDRITGQFTKADNVYYQPRLLTDCARKVIDGLRQQITSGDISFNSKDEVLSVAVEQTAALYNGFCNPSLRRVINATGVALHTNLGRAVLAPEALAAIDDVAAGYCNLEFDLATGNRGSRYDHVSKLLCQLTGAEDAVVVNNNAAAIILALNTLGEGGEAIASRGQLVEIGSSFRISDIIGKGGVTLREVGATNKTRLSDYENAICEKTRLLLTVHPSNFHISGYTESVPLNELVELGRKHNLPVLNDLGSGCIYPLSAAISGREPLVSEVVATGVDLVTLSGDKLLGGPQAGIILGKKSYIGQIKKNQFLRALRIDKFTLAALEATLRIYLTGRPGQQLPVITMLTASTELLRQEAEHLTALLQAGEGKYYHCKIIEGITEAGGGSLPDVKFDGSMVAVLPLSLSADQLAAKLRENVPAIVGYIRDDRVIFDPRTLIAGEAKIVAVAVERICTEARER